MSRCKVLVGVPHTGQFPFQTAYAMLMMQSKYPVEWLLIGQSLIYDSREMMAEKMLKDGYDYLFFLDSDMEPPDDIIPRLMAHDKPIVSAAAHKRMPPCNPAFYKRCSPGYTEVYHDYPKGLLEVEGVGMACALIRREVFEQTPKPWFFPMPDTGEDLAFCIRAREAGFKMYVDTNIICGHVTSFPVTEEHYRYWRGAD